MYIHLHNVSNVGFDNHNFPATKISDNEISVGFSRMVTSAVLNIVLGNWIRYYKLTTVYFQDFNKRHEIQVPPSGSDGLPNPRLKKHKLYDSLLSLIPL